MAEKEDDDFVCETSKEALLCRVLLDQQGIIVDKFARKLAIMAAKNARLPRNPLMERGTFIRTRALDSKIEEMIASREPRKDNSHIHVVVLGAGHDTRWHRHFYKDAAIKSWTDLDHPQVCREKNECLRGFTEHTDKRYRLIECDLRDGINELWLPPAGEALLVISECCLMYLGEVAVDELLGGLCKRTNTQIIAFEAVCRDLENEPEDAFTKQMKKNFQSRSIRIHPISDKKLVAKSTFDMAWGHIQSWTMEECLQFVELPPELCALDEYEEWSLVSSHYKLIIFDQK